jgi:FkbM family methyltransferase
VRLAPAIRAMAMKNIVHSAKQVVNAAAGKLGYRIEKSIDVGDASIDVFDLAVRCVMAERGDFFFIQIGAHNGKDGDPIRKYVTSRHWKGILVEPQPQVFRELVANYRQEPQLVLENAAIAEKDGTAEMYVPRGANGASATLLASFSKEVLVRRVGRNTPIDTIPVPTLSFKTFLSKHRVSHVDLLQVDAEGFDYEIIRMFDYSLAKPTIIRFEHIHLSRAHRRQCTEFLKSLGYRLAKNQIDTIAYLPGA